MKFTTLVLASSISLVAIADDNKTDDLMKYADLEYASFNKYGKDEYFKRNDAFSYFDENSRHIAMFEKMYTSPNLASAKHVDLQKLQSIQTSIFGMDLLGQIASGKSILGFSKGFSLASLGASIISMPSDAMSVGLNEANALHSKISKNIIYIIKLGSHFENRETTKKALQEQVLLFNLFNEAGLNISIGNPRSLWNGQDGVRAQSVGGGKWGFKYEMPGANKIYCYSSVVRVGKNSPIFDESKEKSIASAFCNLNEASTEKIEDVINKLKDRAGADTYIMWVPQTADRRIAWKNGITMELPLFQSPTIELQEAKTAAKAEKEGANANVVVN